MDQFFGKQGHLFREKLWKTFKANKKLLMKAKSLSREENLVNLINSSSNVASANVYKKPIADLFFLIVLASCVAKEFSD